MLMPDITTIMNMPLRGRRQTLFGYDVAIDWWMSIFILGVVVVPSSCFLSTVPFHPSLLQYYGFAIAVLYAGTLLFLALTSVVFLFMTVLCDPGFVFPAVGWASRRQETIPSMELEFEPELEVHYCRVCQLFVERYDHHCGIIGACVGKRNMWCFILFCSSVAVMCALSVPASLVFLGINMILPTSVPTSLHVVLDLFPFPVIKTFVALFGAFYGGGYCAMLAVVYWRYVMSDTHSLVKRRRDQQSRIGQQHDPQNPHLHMGKDFSCCPRGGIQWRAVREVFSEYRTMELTATALHRELLHTTE